MAAGIAPKSVVQNALVCVFADARANELAVAADVGDASDDIITQVGNVGLAPREQIRSWLAEEILHAIRDEPGHDQG